MVGIKGLEMPKGCNDCPLLICLGKADGSSEVYCLTTGENFLLGDKRGQLGSVRGDNCPLVEIAEI